MSEKFDLLPSMSGLPVRAVRPRRSAGQGAVIPCILGSQDRIERLPLLSNGFPDHYFDEHMKVVHHSRMLVEVVSALVEPLYQIGAVSSEDFMRAKVLALYHDAAKSEEMDRRKELEVKRDKLQEKYLPYDSPEILSVSERVDLMSLPAKWKHIVKKAIGCCGTSSVPSLARVSEGLTIEGIRDGAFIEVLVHISDLMLEGESRLVMPSVRLSHERIGEKYPEMFSHGYVVRDDGNWFLVPQENALSGWLGTCVEIELQFAEVVSQWYLDRIQMERNTSTNATQRVFEILVASLEGRAVASRANERGKKRFSTLVSPWPYSSGW